MPRLALILVLVLTTACAAVQPRYSEAVLSDRLFCGLSIPGGGEVTEEEWRAFVRDEVTPRFPDGFTLWRAEGQWRERDGAIIREQVLVIEILHRPAVRMDEEIFAIAEAYKTRFRQQSVMRVTLPARMEFID